MCAHGSDVAMDSLTQSNRMRRGKLDQGENLAVNLCVEQMHVRLFSAQWRKWNNPVDPIAIEPSATFPKCRNFSRVAKTSSAPEIRLQNMCVPSTSDAHKVMWAFACAQCLATIRFYSVAARLQLLNANDRIQNQRTTLCSMFISNFRRQKPYDDGIPNAIPNQCRTISTLQCN